MFLSDLAGQHYSKLSETDLMILEYLLKNKDACTKATIESLAAKCNVSRTTILRFTQKLGFSGYSELKARLKWENQRGGRLPETAMEDVCNNYHKLIEDMKGKDCSRICAMLRRANRIFVYGTGAVQSFVARELKRAFLSARVCMYLVDGSHDEAALTADLMRGDDLGILISLSGESTHGVEFAKKLKSRGVPLISMTKLKNNTLARLSDENLYVSTSEVEGEFALHYETTTLFFMTVEMLLVKYLLYIQQEYDLHPGAEGYLPRGNDPIL